MTERIKQDGGRKEEAGRGGRPGDDLVVEKQQQAEQVELGAKGGSTQPVGQSRDAIRHHGMIPPPAIVSPASDKLSFSIDKLSIDKTSERIDICLQRFRISLGHTSARGGAPRRHARATFGSGPQAVRLARLSRDAT